MWGRNKKQEVFSQEEINKIKEIIKRERDEKFGEVCKAIFSDKEVKHKHYPYSGRCYYTIDNIIFYDFETQFDGYNFNENDSKKLYEMVECKYIYGQSKKSTK